MTNIDALIAHENNNTINLATTPLMKTCKNSYKDVTIGVLAHKSSRTFFGKTHYISKDLKTNSTTPMPHYGESKDSLAFPHYNDTNNNSQCNIPF